MSSTRSYLKAYNIIEDGDMTFDMVSKVTNIQYKDQVCIVITSVNANAIGQWSLEASIDNIHWVPIILDTPIAPTTAGVDDLIMLDMKLLSFSYIRVLWTGTGSGVANVMISAKGN